ncbi:MAG: DNA polymerase III subunit epsilon [Gammaproteobacteria bacterium]|nr:DNA polymerase III subunit epsilon [Gammaproteobacteria bacterium]MCY4358455.1 DNA polymerase III subunit epsilon [Gammaproteobacteria bacterium]
MRQIILDTETTGRDTAEGHRIVEIGCVELQDRRLTSNHFHRYLNPQREVEAGAYEVHGLSAQFLADKPLFADIMDEFIEYVSGAQLVMHNAPFDVGFLDYELSLAQSEYPDIASFCTVFDTLVLASNKHPGQRNSLDALCKRYGIDNSQREKHGALLDAKILAEVYLMMTSGQHSIFAPATDSIQVETSLQVKRTLDPNRPPLRIIRAKNAELDAHQERLEELEKSSSKGALWNRLESGH